MSLTGIAPQGAFAAITLQTLRWPRSLPRPQRSMANRTRHLGSE
jgi:hypothetical protein